MWMFQSLENQCVGLCQLHIYGLTHLRFDKPSKMWKAPDENLKKNRFSFSYKSCSKVFSTSFTFKSSHERMEQRWQSWTQSASGCPLMATGRESWGFRGFGNKRDSWSRRGSSYARRFTYEMISLSNRLCRCEANRNSYGSLTDTPQILREHSMTFFFFSVFTFWVF